MADIIPPPPGFVIDESSIPPPPPGFVTSEPATFTKTAVPIQPEPGFGERLGSNIAKEFTGGIGQMWQGATAPTTERSPAMGPFPSGGTDIVSGGMQALFSPAVGLGKTAGETITDSLAPKIGPNAAAVAAVLGDAAASGISGGLEAKGIGLVGKAIMKSGVIPGSGAAMREAGKTSLEGKISAVRGGNNSTALFNQARQANPTIDLKNIEPRIQELLDQAKLAEPSLRDTKLISILDDMKALATNPSVDLKKVEANLTAIGDRISAAEGTGLGSLKQVYKSLMQALEQQSAQPGGEVLKEALRQKRREHAADTLESMLRNATNPKEGTAVENVTFGQLLKKVRNLAAEKDNLFAGSFDPGELDSITNLLNQVRQTRVIEPGRGVITGSSAAVGRMSIGGAAGSLLGINPWVSAASTEIASRVIARALMTEGGRKLVMNLTADGGLTPVKLAVLGTFVRGATGQNIIPDSTRRNVAGEITKTLKSSQSSLEDKSTGAMILHELTR